MLTMLTTVILTTLTVVPLVSGLWQNCTSNDTCIDGHRDTASEGGLLYCRDFGDDIGGMCYWIDENSPDAGRPYDGYRICGSDYSCGSMWINPNNFDTSDCLRCCYNEANAPNFFLCTETISSGKPNCGNGEITPLTSPCCDGSECLDAVAGICGDFVNSECEACLGWDYIVNQEYMRGDNCGDGMTCFKDPNSGEIPLEDPLGVLGRRLLQTNLIGDSASIYNGVCVGEDGQSISMTEVCSSNNECPSCMRCCDGTCSRIANENECGFEGRGPCCCPTNCKNNECVIETPSPENSYSSSDEMFDAAIGIESHVNDNEIDNDSKYVKYIVSLNGYSSNNLFILSILLILLICGCMFMYHWWGRAKVKQSFQNDTDQPSNI